MAPSRIPIARSLFRACACVLALAFAGTARSQTPTQNDSDFDLLYRQMAPPPNIAILLDDSGSMAHTMWPAEFNPKVFYNTTEVLAACDSLLVPALPNTNGLCAGSGGPNDSCPDTEDTYLLSGPPGQPTLAQGFICDKQDLPPDVCSMAPAGWLCGEPVQNRIRFRVSLVSTQDVRTRWSRNYLAFIIGRILATHTRPELPQTDRLETAKGVLLSVIDRINPPTGAHNANARFALYGFSDTNDGGVLKVGFTGATRQELVDQIRTTRAADFTPLAESLVTIARDMSGNQAIGVERDLSKGPITAGNAMDQPLCAKNFVLLLTDGIPTKDRFGYGPFANEAFEKSIGAEVGAKEGNDLDPLAPLGEVPYDYANDGSDWLDDVSYYLAKNDLRPEGLASGALAETQNITTYVVGFNVDHPLLRNTAEQGEGRYFTTSSGTQLTQALTEAIRDILQRSGSFAASSIPSTRNSSGDAMFTAFFEPKASGNFWPGHLQAYQIINQVPTDPNSPDEPDFTLVGRNGRPVTDADGSFLEPRTNYFWDSALCLGDPEAPCYVQNRTLYHNEGYPASRTTFRAAEISADELGISPTERLNLYPRHPTTELPFTTREDLARSVVNFVRGDDAFDDDDDDDFTERRSAVLGDVFHSNPLTIGSMSVFLTREPGFGPISTAPGTLPSEQGFFDRYYGRPRVVYTGANDGMLHAFDAGRLSNPDGVPLSGDEAYSFGNGAELFGYIPREALPQLKNILNREARKPFFMDGAPTAADVWLPSTTDDVTKQRSEWATVLLSGMRNGGDAVLALDVTDPAAISETAEHGPYPKLLWEFDDPAEFIGKTWSTPVITRLKLRAGVGADYCGEADDDGVTVPDGPADCRETWVAIFGGGYLTQGDPSATEYLASTTAAGWTADSRSLYILEIATGQVLARVAYTPGDAQLEKMTFSVPTTPAVADLNSDGFADVIYFGDIGGQLWKWDVSAVARRDPLSSRVGIDQWPVGVFFSAPVASNGHRRQFFYPPSLSFVQGKLTLAFGSGERTALRYDSTADVDDNHFYVVRDPSPTGANAFANTPLTVDELTQLGPGDTTTKDPEGFYIAGGEDEKFVTDTVAFSGFAVALSYDPELATSTICSAAGRANLYVLNLQDGTGFFKDADGVATRRITVGSGLPTSPRISVLGDAANIIVQTSDGNIDPHKGPKKGRRDVEWIYWRQM